MPKPSDKRLKKRPATVRVISWEPNVWGVAIDRGDGTHDAYMIGSHAAAKAEARRLRAGAALSVPPNA
jgi:hypothetical protein